VDATQIARTVVVSSAVRYTGTATGVPVFAVVVRWTLVRFEHTGLSADRARTQRSSGAEGGETVGILDAVGAHRSLSWSTGDTDAVAAPVTFRAQKTLGTAPQGLEPVAFLRANLVVVDAQADPALAVVVHLAWVTEDSHDLDTVPVDAIQPFVAVARGSTLEDWKDRAVVDLIDTLVEARAIGDDATLQPEAVLLIEAMHATGGADDTSGIVAIVQTDVSVVSAVLSVLAGFTDDP